MPATGSDSLVRDAVIRGSSLGLVKDAHPLNVPASGLVDAENADIFWPGHVQRRGGIVGRSGLNQIRPNIRAMAFARRHDGSRVLVVVDESGVSYDEGLSGTFTVGVEPRVSDIVPMVQARDAIIVGGVSDSALSFDASMNKIKPIAPIASWVTSQTIDIVGGSLPPKHIYYRFTLEYGEGTSFVGETGPIVTSKVIGTGSSGESLFSFSFVTHYVDLSSLSTVTDTNIIHIEDLLGVRDYLKSAYDVGARRLNVYRYISDSALSTEDVEHARLPFTLIDSIEIGKIKDITMPDYQFVHDDGGEPAGRLLDYEAMVGVSSYRLGWKYSAFVKNRLWVANVRVLERNSGEADYTRPEIYPHRIYFSRLSGGRPEPMIFRESSFLEIAPEDGGGITGLAPAGKGALLVTTSSSISLVYVGDVSIDEYLPDLIQRDIPGIGCPAPRSVVSTPLGAMFVSHDGVYIADGKSLVNIADNRVKEVFRSLSDRQRESVSSVYDRRVGRVMMFLPHGDSGENNVAFVYDIGSKRWSRYKYPYGVGAAVEVVELDGGASVLVGVNDTSVDYTTKNTIYTLSSTIWSDDAADVPMSFKTGFLDFGAPTIDKEFLEVGVIADGDDDVTLDFEVEGWGNSEVTGQSVSISPSVVTGELVWESDPDGGVGGYWEYDPNTGVAQNWAGGVAGMRMAAMPRGVVGRSISVKCSTTGSSPMKILGIVVRARFRGRRNTRR